MHSVQGMNIMTEGEMDQISPHNFPLKEMKRGTIVWYTVKTW